MQLQTFAAQDSNGNVQTSPTVYIYALGTTTTISGLQDENGDALSNPFTGGADGRIVVAAPTGTYSMRVVNGAFDSTQVVQFIDVQDQVDAATTQANNASNSADAAGNSADRAVEAVQVATDPNAMVARLQTTYAGMDIRQVAVDMGENSNGWERRVDASYTREDRPNGVYLLQHASLADAITAGGEVEDWYWNTTDKFYYKITATGTPAQTRIYRAGSAHLPAQRAAVLVLGAGAFSNNKYRLLILDLTQVGAPMWREFSAANTTSVLYRSASSGSKITDVKLNSGNLYFSRSGGSPDGLYNIDFVNDAVYLNDSDGLKIFNGDIATANAALDFRLLDSTKALTGTLQVVNALATYTAPDAPLDPVSGMPIPYVAGATDGGVFVIKPDGTVDSAISSYETQTAIAIDDNGYLWTNMYATGGNRSYVAAWPILNTSSVELRASGALGGSASTFSLGSSIASSNKVGELLGGVAGSGYNVSVVFGKAQNSMLVHVPEGLNEITFNPHTPANSLIAKIGSNYNTGWYRDGAGTAAIMCDTDTGVVSDANNLLPTYDFQDGSWIRATGDTIITGANTFTSSATGTGLFANKLPTGYVVYVEISFTSSSSITLEIRNGSTSSAPTFGVATGTSGTILGKAFVTDGNLYFRVGAGIVPADIEIASVKIYKGVTDRTGNENHFDINGSLTRTAINGGIAAYSGFSATDYLSSTDAALDVNGVAFTWACAFRTSSNIAGMMVATGETNKLRRMFISDGNLFINMEGLSVISPGRYDDGGWHTAICIVSDSGEAHLIADGEAVATGALSLSAFSFTEIFVGVDLDGDPPFTGSLANVTLMTGVEWSIEEAKQWCRDMRQVIETGAATLPSAITDAAYDERGGVLQTLHADGKQRQIKGLTISTGTDATGKTAAVAADDRATVIGGTGGLTIDVASKNLREKSPVKQIRRFTVTYAGDASRTAFPSTFSEREAVQGAKPVKVWNAGTLLTAGAADDYTIQFDGFAYWAELAVAPGSGNDVIVEFEKEIYS